MVGADRDVANPDCAGVEDGGGVSSYLIFVIFFTRAKFLENKIYNEIYCVNCQFTQ